MDNTVKNVIMEIKEVTSMGDEKGWIKDILLDSWDVVIEGIAKEKKQMLQMPNGNSKKWKIESRTKIKSLNESLQQFEDAESAVLHFVKYAEYYLPRSELNKTLHKILEKVSKIRKSGVSPEEMKEQIQYLVGYTSWSLDGFVNILNISENDDEIKKNLKMMIGTELSIAGVERETGRIVNGLVKWHDKAKRGK